jgi:CRISPR-associated endonuclease Csn1
MPGWQEEDESNRERYDEMKRRLNKRIKLKEPWEDFWKHVEYSVNSIVVSHRVNRKISGALHEETYYGPTDEKAPKNKEMMVVRKPVHQLSQKRS